MGVSTAQSDTIKGIILSHLSDLWAFADHDGQLLSQVLVKLSDDSISSRDFRAFCERFQGSEEYFISTLRKLRRMAFPTDASVAALNQHYTDLDVGLFDLKSKYSTTLSEVLSQLSENDIPGLIKDSDVSVAHKVPLIKSFLDINAEDSDNTLEYKKVDIEVRKEHLHPELAPDNNTTLEMEAVEEKSVRSSALKQHLHRMVHSFHSAKTSEERRAVNLELRKLIYQVKVDTPDARLDFSMQDLSGLDLNNLDLASANFSNTKLTQTNLSGSSVVQSNFADAELVGVQFDEDTNLTRANFTGAKLDRAMLSAIIEQARAEELAIYLQHVDLSHQDLSGLDLSDIDFTDASFISADLTDVELDNCNLNGADLTGVKNLPLDTLLDEENKVTTSPSTAGFFASDAKKQEELLSPAG